MNLHLGHHFFGAGNAGDDFMLAGFLAALPSGREVRLTCAVPHHPEPLRARFPQVEWLPYTDEARRRAVEKCDAWLGLGGTPFQSGVSSWFLDHLAQEAGFCADSGKRMFFLGVGGQDAAAYRHAGAAEIVRRAAHIWTRDERTAAALRLVRGAQGVSAGADLAHLFFARHPPPPAAAGRLTVTLNFDYREWPALPRMLEELERMPARERVWAAQEERELPGAERQLWSQFTDARRARWQLAVIGGPSAASALASWPTGDWQLTSRYHAALVSAWAGSRTVVVALNEKLRAAADETGFPVLEWDGGGDDLSAFFDRAEPTPRDRLAAQARRAAQACAEFFAAL